MRFWRREIVRPTLLFSSAGVMVEAYEEHTFGDSSPPLVVGRYKEVEPPRGAAICAVQFVHTIGHRFEQLQCFALHYYMPQQPGALLEAYLSSPNMSDMKMRAVAVGADTLNKDTKRVLSTLLVKSDPEAWEASAEFRRILESGR
ncbi:MAG TPA: hypothetical protein VGE07_14155 [Herpetosiphonaceae bacterium]